MITLTCTSGGKIMLNPYRAIFKEEGGKTLVYYQTNIFQVKESLEQIRNLADPPQFHPSFLNANNEAPIVGEEL